MPHQLVPFCFHSCRLSDENCDQGRHVCSGSVASEVSEHNKGSFDVWQSLFHVHHDQPLSTPHVNLSVGHGARRQVSAGLSGFQKQKQAQQPFCAARLLGCPLSPWSPWPRCQPSIWRWLRRYSLCLLLQEQLASVLPLQWLA